MNRDFLIGVAILAVLGGFALAMGVDGILNAFDRAVVHYVRSQ